MTKDLFTLNGQKSPTSASFNYIAGLQDIDILQMTTDPENLALRHINNLTYAISELDMDVITTAKENLSMTYITEEPAQNYFELSLASAP